MDYLQSAMLIIKISLMDSFGPRSDGYVCKCVFIKACVFASICVDVCMYVCIYVGICMSIGKGIMSVGVLMYVYKRLKCINVYVIHLSICSIYVSLWSHGY